MIANDMINTWTIRHFPQHTYILYSQSPTAKAVRVIACVRPSARHCFMGLPDQKMHSLRNRWHFENKLKNNDGSVVTDAFNNKNYVN